MNKMNIIVTLNRSFRLLARLFFAVVGIGIALIFGLMLLSVVTESKGSPQLQHLIGSDGFFPWPVAAMFSLEGFAPWLIGIGLVGAAVGFVLRRLIFRHSERVQAKVVAVSQTGTTVNSRPRMRLTLSIGARNISIKTLIDLGNIPRPGDQVWLLVSRADPSFVQYGGLA